MTTPRTLTERGATSATRAGGGEPMAKETQCMMGDIDFSRVNLHYLICARDLAKASPACAAVLLGVPEDLVHLLADLDAEVLAAVTDIKAPLLILRQEPWWWKRLFTALRADRSDEVQSILEQAGLIIANG